MKQIETKEAVKLVNNYLKRIYGYAADIDHDKFANSFASKNAGFYKSEKLKEAHMRIAGTSPIGYRIECSYEKTKISWFATPYDILGHFEKNESLKDDCRKLYCEIMLLTSLFEESLYDFFSPDIEIV